MVQRPAVDPMTLSENLPRPFRGPFTRWPRSADVAIALFVLLLTLFSGDFQDPDTAENFSVTLLSDLPPFAYLIPVVGSACLYWRRRLPLIVLGVTVVGSALWVGLSYSPDPLFGWPFAVYSVGRYVANDRLSYGAIGLSVGLIAMGAFFDGGPTAAIPLDVLFVAAPWYVGRRIRNREAFVRILQERAQYLEREQEAEAHRTLADERTRIARELHDVVAHRVSLMTIQAGAAKTVAAEDPEGALQSMEAVEQAGRQALGELRHLLGVLRPDAAAGALGPQPGIAEIPHLAEEVRQAGVDVRLTVGDVPDDLPGHVELSAFRIVQEALTNVLKHAGPDAAAEVTLRGAPEAVTIEVVNTGSATNGLTGSGHGIVGMRERAILLGGSLEAGPVVGGGFRVTAHLPIAGGIS